MKKHWREIFYGFFIIAGGMILILQPFRSALDERGHRALMGMLLTTGLWILEPCNISCGIASCFLFAYMLALGLPADVVFSGFVQSSVWTMVPALFFGFALQKTGLGKRIAFLLLKNIRHVSCASLLLAWALIGIILSVMTPSITVRVVLAMPLALNCIELCGLPENSKERSILLLSAWAMMVIPGIGWPSGSLLGAVLTGIFSMVGEIPEITFAGWCRASLLPTAVVTVCLLAAGMAALRHTKPLGLSQDAFRDVYQKLPPISREEKTTLAVLCGSFLLLATASLHHIPDAAVCLFGFFILCIFRVIRADEIGTGISWNIVLFVGATMSLGGIFSYTGVSDWLSGIMLRLFSGISSPAVLILLTTAALFAWRFVDVALLTPTVIVLAPVLPRFLQAYGIHPFVWIPVFSFAICSFFMRYQNMFLLIGETTLGNRGWTGKYRIRYALLYFAACLLAVALGLPYWKMTGLIL